MIRFLTLGTRSVLIPRQTQHIEQRRGIEYHPEKHPKAGDGERQALVKAMQTINAAYDFMKRDMNRRRAWDADRANDRYAGAPCEPDL